MKPPAMIGKQIFYMMLSSMGVLAGLRRRLPNDGVTVLMYHELAHDRADVEAWTVVRKSEFQRQIEYLRRHYDVIGLDEALQRMRAGVVSSRPPVVLTFDDGDAGNYEILLPLVEALELPVTVYIATGQVLHQRPYWFDRLVNALQGDTPHVLDLGADGLGRYAINNGRKGARNWVEIQRLLTDLKQIAPDRREAIADRIADGARRGLGDQVYQVRPLTLAEIQALGASRWITLGAHSHCHNLLTQIPLAEAEESIARSRDLLREWTGRAVQHFAYPNGAHNPELAQLVERLGFASGSTTDEALWRATDSPFRIPRIAVGRYDSIETFRVNLLGRVQSVRRLVG